MDAELKNVLITQEQALHSPKGRACDKTIDALLHPDFEEYSSSGTAYGKEKVLASLPQENNIKIQSSHFVARQLDTHLVQITYQTSVLNAETGAERHALRSSLWKKTAENIWQMIFHQSTPQ